jgi:hypothetical protein
VFPLDSQDPRVIQIISPPYNPDEGGSTVTGLSHISALLGYKIVTAKQATFVHINAKL